MSANQRKQIVLEYFDQMNRMLKIRGQMDEIFTDPKQTDPVAASRDLRAQLDQTRARLDQLQPLAEGILQEQISAILTEEGFTTGGQLLPPISFHISALPGYLIVSPRDRIERIAYSMVEPGLSADDKVALESKIEKELNVSAIIEPIGGLGSYPAMVYETANLNYIAEVGAHEWSHNYLTLRPLGINYDNSPQLRTINETTATIFGQEIGRMVIARYYPERVPPPTPTPSPRPTRTHPVPHRLVIPTSSTLILRCARRESRSINFYSMEKLSKPKPTWKSGDNFFGRRAIRFANSTKPILLFTDRITPVPEQVVKTRWVLPLLNFVNAVQRSNHF